MANRRYRKLQPNLQPDDLISTYGNDSDLIESLIKTTPSYQSERSKFDYSQLDEKYPVNTIYGDIIKKDIQDRKQKDLQEEINYRKSLIEDRASQLELKKAARDLDMYESQINREDAMLEQIPVARQKLASLDVRDPDFINKAYDIQDEHPLAFESQDFQKYVFQPMLNRNSRLTGRRQEGVITPSEAKQAMDEIMKYETLKEQEYPNEEHSDQLKKYLGIQQNTLNQFYSQRGMTNPMGATVPQPAGIAPALAPSPDTQKTPSFKEGKIYKQGGKQYRYVNGQFVELP